MLYLNLLEKYRKLLNPEFQLLEKKIIENQKYFGDFLLVYTNFFKSDFPKNNSPYKMGPNFEGLSGITHFNFIDTYRKINILENDLIEIPIGQKKLSIQIEMLIYLKIWECDYFIKKLYQIARLLNGESYDWNFKISYDNYDKTATGTRHKILREHIRDKFKTHLPELFNAFKESYITQLRNAIAHSQYYLQNDVIGLNNYDEKSKFCKLRSLSFKDWSKIFHITQVIYNEYLLFIDRINNFYISESEKSTNGIQFIIDDDSYYKEYHLKYITRSRRWQWLD